MAIDVKDSTFEQEHPRGPGGRFRDKFEEMALGLAEMFRLALKTRTKDGYKWKPPEGWADVYSGYGQGVVQYAQNVEYEGERATIIVTGKHAGKRGVWNTKAGVVSWDRFSPEILKLRDEIADVPQGDNPYETRSRATEKAEKLGLIQVGRYFTTKTGDEALVIERNPEDVPGAFVFPARLGDSEKRWRFRDLLEAEDPAALRIGETSLQDVKDGSYASGWNFSAADEEKGIWDLTYRRDDHEDLGNVELKGYRLKFGPDGLLEEIGKPQAGSNEVGTEEDFQKIARAEKEKYRQEFEERNKRVTAIAAKIKEALAQQRDVNNVFDGTEDWDETREALQRLNFYPLKRSSRKVGYTEVWRRRATKSEIYLQIDPVEGGAPIPRRFQNYAFGMLMGRPRPGQRYAVKADKAKVTVGELEHTRQRLKRVPLTEDEWKTEILGRADELAKHYGEETSAALVTFCRPGDKDAPPDHNAWIDSDGILVFGATVLPDLLAYSKAVSEREPQVEGQQPLFETGGVPEEILGPAWSAWETVQHEVNHSVNRAAGWFGGYSDSDGSKNFEETLTEELARVIVSDWMTSSEASDLDVWAKGHAASAGVQGAYQLYRSNFKGLLDELRIPEDERHALLERWKFNTSWKERMTEFSSLMAEKLGMTQEDAEKHLKDVLQEKSLARNGYTRGFLRVQEFRPILPVGPMPPVRSDVEIQELWKEVEPIHHRYLTAREEFEQALSEMRAAKYGPDFDAKKEAAKIAANALDKIRNDYMDALDAHALAPPETDYT